MRKRPWIPRTEISGALDFRYLEDGRLLVIYPLFGNCARLTLSRESEDLKEGDLKFYDDAWDYDTLALATEAMNTWGGRGEPTGWMRHPPSGRRRPGGDPEKEYVRL